MAISQNSPNDFLKENLIPLALTCSKLKYYTQPEKNVSPTGKAKLLNRKKEKVVGQFAGDNSGVFEN